MADETLPTEAADHDALEQRQDVGPGGDAAVSDDPEAPEGDALDQARTVADDEPDPEGA